MSTILLPNIVLLVTTATRRELILKFSERMSLSAGDGGLGVVDSDGSNDICEIEIVPKRDGGTKRIEEMNETAERRFCTRIISLG